MSRLYVGRAPSYSGLEAFVLDLSIPGEGKGAFLQGLKAKCRELARADSAVLVAPTAESLSAPFGMKQQLSLWLITKSGNVNLKLGEKLKQLDLKVSHKVAVSYGILQACYQFTLVARLAPKWNRIGSWLVKGSEFLTTGKAPALSLEVGMTRLEITLTLTICKLSLSFLKPQDLEVTTSTLNQFFTDPQFVIRETSIYSNRCLLLPNFSVGYIFSASHQLPPSMEFLNYDKVRLHWKKQHGIIVPERQDLFYQVFFKSNPGNFFSYPGCCVYKAHPLVFPNKDTDVVASAFIADIHARMPSICGEPMRFSSKALTPFSQLHSATSYQALSNARPAPMKSSMRPPGVSVPFRQTPISSLSNPAKGPQMGSGNTPPKGRVMEPQQSQLVPSFASKNYSQASSGVRIVPIFQPKACRGSQKQQHPRHNTSCDQQASTPIALTFKPTLQSNGASTTKKVPAQKREMQSASGHSKAVPSLMKAATCASLKINSMQQFSGAKQPGGQRAQADQLLNSITPPAKRPCLAPTAITLQEKSRQLQQTIQQIVPDTSQPECLNISHDRSFNESIFGDSAKIRAPKPVAEQRPSKNTTNEVSLSHCKKHVVTKCASVRGNNASMSSQITSPKAQLRAPLSPVWTGFDTSSSAGSALVENSNCKSKPSKKAEPLQIEGMSGELMKKILKTKAALLKKWLQENGVKCRCKDKKEDLVRMAAQHIKETGKSFHVAA